MLSEKQDCYKYKNINITKVYDILQFEYYVCNSNKKSKYKHISLIE